LKADRAKIAEWCTPEIEKLIHCKNCGFFGACAGIGCPIRKIEQCPSVIDAIKPYLRAFYDLSPKSYDVSSFFERAV